MVSATGTRLPRLGHLPALDGLRGLAVVAVLIHHIFVSERGGWVGVDVFFVLSGFLITALLVSSWTQRGPEVLRSFWVKRLRRLLPALVVLLAVYTWVLHSVLGVGTGFGLAELLALPHLNLHLTADLPASPELSHLWSIAAEIQFYSLWPIVLVLLLAARVRPLSVATALIAVALASAAFRLALSLDGAEWHRLYFGFDTRADGFALGAAVGMLHAGGHLASARVERSLRALALPAAAVLVAFATWGDATSDMPYRGGLLAATVAAAVLVAGCAAPSTGEVVHGLEARPLQSLGRISYSLYLWHLPILATVGVLELGLDSAPRKALIVGASVVAAALSYHLVERPFTTGRVGAAGAALDRRLAEALVPGARPQASAHDAPSPTSALAVVYPLAITTVFAAGVAAAILGT